MQRRTADGKGAFLSILVLVSPCSLSRLHSSTAFFRASKEIFGRQKTMGHYKRASKQLVGLPDLDRGWEETQAKTFCKW